MNSDANAVQLRLRVEALDRIRRGYDLVYSGVGILAALSVPGAMDDPLTRPCDGAQNGAKSSASGG